MRVPRSQSHRKTRYTAKGGCQGGEVAHIAQVGRGDHVNKDTPPLVAVDDVAAVCVLPEPLQHRVGELLVRVGLHYLRLEVGRLQALPIQVGLLVDGPCVLTEGLLLGHPQEGHLLAGASSGI